LPSAKRRNQDEIAIGVQHGGRATENGGRQYVCFL
jgi:hypothetical protein